MKLLTEEVRRQLPPLYEQEKAGDPIVHIKFFTPDSNWTWYVTEGGPQGQDFIFFGFVIGFEREWGYFALSELESARGPRGLAIERDLYFSQAPLSQVLEREGHSEGLRRERARPRSDSSRPQGGCSGRKARSRTPR